MATDANLKLSNELADSVALREFATELLCVPRPRMTSLAGQRNMNKLIDAVLDFAPPAQKAAAE